MQTRRCGIVLAAGEGKNVKSFIKRWTGSNLPKQYVKFNIRGVENDSTLERTFHRVEKVIPNERIFTVVDQKHLFYTEVLYQLDGRAKGTVISQPQNKKTVPELLLPLAHLLRRHPKACVALFPSDHHIENDDLFTEYLEQAFSFVEDDPSRIILLGIQPSHQEEDYGYILPGPLITQSNIPAYSIEQFSERPAKKTVAHYIQNGGLWNTNVMVFHSETLLGWVLEEFPSLFDAFLTIYSSIGTPEETKTTEDIYQNLEPLKISSDLLHRIALSRPSPLAVLPVQGLTWTDLDSENRILYVLRHNEDLLAC